MGEVTYDDFDDWGVGDAWNQEASYTGDDWWSSESWNNDNYVNWDDSYDVAEDESGSFFGSLFGFVNQGIDGYYNMESNRAIREARLEQIKLTGGTPQPRIIREQSSGIDNQTLLIASVALVGLVLIAKA